MFTSFEVYKMNLLYYYVFKKMQYSWYLQETKTLLKSKKKDVAACWDCTTFVHLYPC